jgi:hypothetical protein
MLEQELLFPRKPHVVHLNILPKLSCFREDEIGVDIQAGGNENLSKGKEKKGKLK